MTDDVVALLQAGKDRIAVGWCRSALTQINAVGQEEVCALGALIHSDAPPGSEEFYDEVFSGKHLSQLYRRAKDALGATTGHNCSTVTWHNNVCLRDQADALDWFDRAIRHAKEH